MFIRSKTVALFAVALLTACAHGGTVPTPSNQTAQTAQINSVSTASASAVTTGNFTEYALPAGVNPSDLAHGPYDTLWFTQSPVSPFPPPGKVWQMVKSTGKLHAFTAGFIPGSMPPFQFTNYDSSIVSAGRAIWFLLNGTEDNVYVTRLTPEGAFSYFSDNAGAVYTNFTQGPDGRVWYGGCGLCGFLNNTIVRSVSGNFVFGPSLSLGNTRGLVITPGPGGNLYLTAETITVEPPPASNSFVDVI